jgi:hypothetical protein
MPHAVGYQAEDRLDKARNDRETGSQCGGGPQGETQTRAEDGNQRRKECGVPFDKKVTTGNCKQCFSYTPHRSTLSLEHAKKVTSERADESAMNASNVPRETTFFCY